MGLLTAADETPLPVRLGRPIAQNRALVAILWSSIQSLIFCEGLGHLYLKTVQLSLPGTHQELWHRRSANGKRPAKASCRRQRWRSGRRLPAITKQVVHSRGRLYRQSLLYILEVRKGLVPVKPSGCSRLMMATVRWPARELPPNSQFVLPCAKGRIRFSMRLLPAASSASSIVGADRILILTFESAPTTGQLKLTSTKASRVLNGVSAVEINQDQYQRLGSGSRPRPLPSMCSGRRQRGTCGGALSVLRHGVALASAATRRAK